MSQYHRYIENKSAYIHLLEFSQEGGTRITVTGLEDNKADEILDEITKLIENNGIPDYIKNWDRYQMKKKYSSIEKFNIDLKRLVASYHHHSHLYYEGMYVATPDDRKKWKKYAKKIKKSKIQITKDPRKMPEFELKNNIGKIIIYHFNLEFENGKPNKQSRKDQKKQVKQIQSQLKKWKKQKIKGLILDFRQHVGGCVVHLYEAFADIFEGATIYGWKNSQAKKSDKIWINVRDSEVLHDQKYISNDLNWNIPIAILIGENTASSGEFGAVMFYGRSNTRLFGENTGGYLSGNDTRFIGDNYMLTMTESLVNTPDLTFHLTEKIEPDVVTSDPIKAARNWISNY
jgi:peptidase S41-like protein